MKAVLEIGKNDLNIHLIEVINALFNQDVREVIIRKSAVNIEEFDKNLKIENVIDSLKEYGHNELLLNDIGNGLKNSSVYAKQN